MPRIIDRLAAQTAAVLLNAGAIREQTAATLDQVEAIRQMGAAFREVGDARESAGRPLPDAPPPAAPPGAPVPVGERLTPRAQPVSSGGGGGGGGEGGGSAGGGAGSGLGFKPGNLLRVSIVGGVSATPDFIETNCVRGRQRMPNPNNPRAIAENDYLDLDGWNCSAVFGRPVFFADSDPRKLAPKISSESSGGVGGGGAASTPGSRLPPRPGPVNDTPLRRARTTIDNTGGGDAGSDEGGLKSATGELVSLTREVADGVRRLADATERQDRTQLVRRGLV